MLLAPDGESKGLDTQAIIAAELDCRLAFNFYLVGTTESAAIIALCSHKNQSDYRHSDGQKRPKTLVISAVGQSAKSRTVRLGRVASGEFFIVLTNWVKLAVSPTSHFEPRNVQAPNPNRIGLRRGRPLEGDLSKECYYTTTTLGEGERATLLDLSKETSTIRLGEGELYYTTTT